MKFILNKGCAILFVVLLFCASCGDTDLFDTDKWSSKIDGWEPGVTAKVAHGEFTLWDLINQGTDSVIVKEGNNLYIQYLEEDIYRIEIDEIFNMPKDDVNFSLSYTVNTTIPGLGIPLPMDIEVEDLFTEAKVNKIPDGCVVKKLEASATFVYPIADFNYYIEAEFPNITRNGEVLRLSREVAANELLDERLDHILLTLTEDQKVDLNITKIIIRAGSELQSLDLDMEFGLNDLQFIKVEGKIEVPPIDIPEDHFDMNVDFLNEIGGSFKFSAPELNVIVRNKGIGLPIEVDASFDGRNEDKAVTLTLNPDKKLIQRIIPNHVDTLGFDADNSNIVDFLSLPPQGDIKYRGKVYVNPQGEEDNIVYSDGEITLDAYVRIPFKLSASGLSYKDTLTDIDIDQKYADKIKSGVIRLVAKNGLPLNLSIPTLILIAEDGTTLTSLKAVNDKALLKAESEESILEFTLNAEQAAMLGKTKNILLEAIASTPGNADKTVAADAKLSFSLVVAVKAEINDYDDF